MYWKRRLSSKSKTKRGDWERKRLRNQEERGRKRGCEENEGEGKKRKSIFLFVIILLPVLSLVLCPSFSTSLSLPSFFSSTFLPSFLFLFFLSSASPNPLTFQERTKESTGYQRRSGQPVLYTPEILGDMVRPRSRSKIAPGAGHGRGGRLRSSVVDHVLDPGPWPRPLTQALTQAFDPGEVRAPSKRPLPP